MFKKKTIVNLQDEAKLWLAAKGDNLSEVNVKLRDFSKFNMKTMWLKWKGSFLLALIGLTLCYFIYCKYYYAASNVAVLFIFDVVHLPVAYTCRLFFFSAWHGKHPKTNPCLPVRHQDVGLHDLSYYCNFVEKPVIGKEGNYCLFL